MKSNSYSKHVFKISIELEDLKLALTHHGQRENGLVYMTCFFEVTKYSGEIKNNEPNKCDDLRWFDYVNLPENTIDYVKFALNQISEGKNVAVWGW